MKLTDFKQPSTLEEARAALRESGDRAVPIAGGTSHVFTPEGDERMGVDINRLGLDGISRENGSFHIGATTRLCDLQSHRAEGWALDRVAVNLASQQIRNMSTLGGNIARVFPWSDFPVALLALGASMIIAGDGEQELSADDFFASQPARLFKDGTLLVAVKVPAVGDGVGFGYRKEKQAEMGFSLTTTAVWLEADGNTVKNVRIAVGAAVPFPRRVLAAEEALTGKRGGDSAFTAAAARGVGELKFKANSGMTEEYIAHLAEVAIRDALAEAWSTAKGGAA